MRMSDRFQKQVKWAPIARLYELEIELHGKRSICRLAERASIGYSYVRNVIDYYKLVQQCRPVATPTRTSSTNDPFCHV